VQRHHEVLCCGLQRTSARNYFITHSKAQERNQQQAQNRRVWLARAVCSLPKTSLDLAKDTQISRGTAHSVAPIYHILPLALFHISLIRRASLALMSLTSARQVILQFFLQSLLALASYIKYHPSHNRLLPSSSLRHTLLLLPLLAPSHPCTLSSFNVLHCTPALFHSSSCLSQLQAALGQVAS
jgi:hypothetical protein